MSVKLSALAPQIAELTALDPVLVRKVWAFVQEMVDWLLDIFYPLTVGVAAISAEAADELFAAKVEELKAKHDLGRFDGTILKKLLELLVQYLPFILPFFVEPKPE